MNDSKFFEKLPIGMIDKDKVIEGYKLLHKCGLQFCPGVLEIIKGAFVHSEIDLNYNLGLNIGN